MNLHFLIFAMRAQANDETNFQFSCFTSSFPSSARSILLVCCQAVMNTFFHASCLPHPLRPHENIIQISLPDGYCRCVKRFCHDRGNTRQEKPQEGEQTHKPVIKKLTRDTTSATVTSFFSSNFSSRYFIWKSPVCCEAV